MYIDLTNNNIQKLPEWITKLNGLLLSIDNDTLNNSIDTLYDLKKIPALLFKKDEKNLIEDSSIFEGLALFNIEKGKKLNFYLCNDYDDISKDIAELYNYLNEDSHKLRIFDNDLLKIYSSQENQKLGDFIIRKNDQKLAFIKSLTHIRDIYSIDDTLDAIDQKEITFKEMNVKRLIKDIIESISKDVEESKRSNVYRQMAIKYVFKEALSKEFRKTLKERLNE